MKIKKLPYFGNVMTQPNEYRNEKSKGSRTQEEERRAWSILSNGSDNEQKPSSEQLPMK